MGSDGVVFQAANLTKQFGYSKALDNASLALNHGESLVIYGHNGAGKTTLLKIAAGIIRSYRGAVSLFGRDLKRAAADVKSRIGFVTHQSFLYNDLTVLDNLLFYARLYRVDQPTTRAKAMVEMVGLETRTRSLVRELSRGMKQRLSIGRALLHSPDLLLLDEPFSGLDDSAVGLLDRRLSDFRAAGGTVMMTTHDAGKGWRHADRVCILDQGRVVYEIAADETTLDAFEERYRAVLSGVL